VTVTCNDCEVDMLLANGVTVTVGATMPFTVTVAVPDALLYLDELDASGEKEALSVALPAGRLFAGMVIVAVPAVRTVEPEA
jgi:hypothetical protein